MKIHFLILFFFNVIGFSQETDSVYYEEAAVVNTTSVETSDNEAEITNIPFEKSVETPRKFQDNFQNKYKIPEYDYNEKIKPKVPSTPPVAGRPSPRSSAPAR